MDDAGSELQSETDPALLLRQSKRPSLSSLQIPARSLESTLSSPGSTRGLPPRPNSAKVKSSMRNLFSDRSFRANKTSSQSQDNTERTVLILPDTLSSDASVNNNSNNNNKPSTTRSLSLNKILFPSSSKAAHSLPVTPITNSGPDNLHGRYTESGSSSSKMEVIHHITRSFSVPVNVKATNFRRTDSRGLIRVISAKPHLATTDGISSHKASDSEIVNKGASQDIPEEEAVCRICLVELGEGGNTLRMECSCKGELALAHQDCAVKWFSIKGNKTCDICKHDVENLPVTLLKISNPPPITWQPLNPPQRRELIYYRIWQDIPILVLVSMLAYFCFLEELLVSELGSRALAVSLPFSCVLGFLSSMIAATMVSRSYIWAYACFQFALVILFAHLFYTLLNVNAILSVLLSSFTGFGISISTNTLLLQCIRWRTSRQNQSSNMNINVTQQQEHQRQHHHLQRLEQQQDQ